MKILTESSGRTPGRQSTALMTRFRNRSVAAVAATAILADIAEDLVRTVLRSHPGERAISLLAISVSHIEEQPVVQLDLPLGLPDESRRPGAKGGMARLLADRAIDTIRNRFGWESVGYASVALDGRRSVPDAFRKLAEREL